MLQISILKGQKKWPRKSRFAGACDVRKEEDILLAVKLTEERFGPIDMFCSNAGIAFFGGVEVEDQPMAEDLGNQCPCPYLCGQGRDSRYDKQGWGVSFKHGFGGRAAQPDRFAPYSVTKHAAVGLAENLAITYGDQGIKVSVVMPPGGGYAHGSAWWRTAVLPGWMG